MNLLACTLVDQSLFDKFLSCRRISSLLEQSFSSLEKDSVFFYRVLNSNRATVVFGNLNVVSHSSKVRLLMARYCFGFLVFLTFYF